MVKKMRGKKVVLILIMLLVTTQLMFYYPELDVVVKAAENILLYEGFENSWPPDGWSITVFNSNGNWTQTTTGVYPTASPYQGKHMAMFNSFYSPSGEKARLETPWLSKTGYSSLILDFWMHHSTYGEGGLDKIVVQLSGDGNTWINLSIISRYSSENSWRNHKVTIPLEDVEEDFKIGFLGVSDFSGNMYIDEVTIAAPPVNDVGVTSVSKPASSFIQAGTPVNVMATVHNFGVATQSNIPVKLRIIGPNGYSYEDTTTLHDVLYQNQTLEVEFTSDWTPSDAPGVYTIRVYTTLQGDEDESNNGTTKEVTVYLENQLYESFESWPPERWVIVDNSVSHWEQDNVFHEPHSGNYSAYAGINPGGEADCWLITPRVEIQENDVLSFWYTTGALQDGYATFEVFLSTSSSPTDINGFNVLLWSSTSSSNEWVKKSVSLSQHSGQLVYIGFHLSNLTDSMESLLIDDVLGPTLWKPNHDVAPITLNQPENGDVIGEHFVNASVKNHGASTESFTVTCSIYRLRDETGAPFATLVYNGNAFVSNLGSGETTNVVFTPSWDAAEYGFYAVNVTTMLSGDEEPWNDYINQTVYIDLPFQSGLRVEKTVWHPGFKQWVNDCEVNQGGLATMRITVTNTFDTPVTDVNITDALPDGLEYADESTLNGKPVKPNLWDNHVTWSVSFIGADDAVEIVFKVNVTGCGYQVNKVNVTGAVIEDDHAVAWSGENDTATIIPVDVTPPVTKMVLRGPAAQMNDVQWISNITHINLSAYDKCSDTVTFYRIWYNGEWGNWKTYTKELLLTKSCTHIVEFYSTDSMGNIEEKHRVTLNVDVSPPTSVFETGKPFYNIDVDNETIFFVSQNTSLFINATDTKDCNTGLYQILYNIWSNTGWTGWLVSDYNKNVSFTLPDKGFKEEGVYNLIYYSKDILDNAEQPLNAVLVMDDTPPETTLIIDGSSFMDQQQRLWVSKSTTLGFSAVDEGVFPAGVKETLYAVDDESLHSYKKPFTLTEGMHTLRFLSWDNVDNVETMVVKQVGVDVTPPYTDVDYEGPVYHEETRVWVTSETKIILKGYDKESGVNTTYYRVDNGPWFTYTEPFYIPWQGEHMLSIYSVDHVGNTQTVVNKTIIVYNTPPKIKIDLPKKGWLHVFGKPLFPIILRKAFVVGKLVVVVSVQSNQSIMSNVSFLVDGKTMFVDNKPPYRWEYTERLLLNHELQVVAFDKLGHAIKELLPVFFFSL